MGVRGTTRPCIISRGGGKQRDTAARRTASRRSARSLARPGVDGGGGDGGGSGGNSGLTRGVNGFFSCGVHDFRTRARRYIPYRQSYPEY